MYCVGALGICLVGHPLRLLRIFYILEADFAQVSARVYCVGSFGICLAGHPLRLLRTCYILDADSTQVCFVVCSSAVRLRSRGGRALCWFSWCVRLLLQLRTSYIIEEVACFVCLLGSSSFWGHWVALFSYLFGTVAVFLLFFVLCFSFGRWKCCERRLLWFWPVVVYSCPAS